MCVSTDVVDQPGLVNNNSNNNKNNNKKDFGCSITRNHNKQNVKRITVAKLVFSLYSFAENVSFLGAMFVVRLQYDCCPDVCMGVSPLRSSNCLSVRPSPQFKALTNFSFVETFDIFSYCSFFSFSCLCFFISCACLRLILFLNKTLNESRRKTKDLSNKPVFYYRTSPPTQHTHTRTQRHERN